eukprot:6488444-Amphidinium_carterae.1
MIENSNTDPHVLCGWQAALHLQALCHFSPSEHFDLRRIARCCCYCFLLKAWRETALVSLFRQCKLHHIEAHKLKESRIVQGM